MKNPFANLPRDSRDTLFLLGVIGWTVLPHVTHLPWWCSALTTAMLLWRGWLVVSLRPLPGRWWLLVCLVLTVLATLATYRTLLGRDVGVTLVVALLALKTLELRARRDAFVVFFLGFFTMLTNFFYSQSLLTAAAMLLGVMGLLTALVNSHMPAGRPSLWQSAHMATRMVALGAPIMVLLFVLFPRFAPLWGTPGDAMSGRSGLSGHMQVGQITSLALDDSVAMRIRFEDNVTPPQSSLYFRGPVLSTFDGRDWQELQTTFSQRFQVRSDLQVGGSPLRYEVTLEPHNRPWLLTLDATPHPPDLPGDLRARMKEDLMWWSSAPVNDLLRYKAESYLDFRHGPMRAVASLQDFLAQPSGFNPRTQQWAQELLRSSQAEPRRVIELALERLRTGGYYYTLEPDAYGQHTADEFWFDRKAGFCEHIASSFVLLMRAAGIPARIVTGYQGGERNTIDNFWVVRQSDAHAWTEVWLAGQGWVRVDPTGAVSPGRIGTLQRLRVPRGAVAAMVDTVGTVVGINVADNLRAVWEAVNNAWNQKILNYTQSRQLNLLRSLGFDNPSWEDLGYLLLGGLILASLSGVVWTQWERRRHDPWLRLLERARDQLQRSGHSLGVGVTPREMARKLAQTQDSQDNRLQAIQMWLLRFEQLRYAPRQSQSEAADLATLRTELKQLNWPT